MAKSCWDFLNLWPSPFAVACTCPLSRILTWSTSLLWASQDLNCSSRISAILFRFCASKRCSPNSHPSMTRWGWSLKVCWLLWEAMGKTGWLPLEADGGALWLFPAVLGPLAIDWPLFSVAGFNRDLRASRI